MHVYCWTMLALDFSGINSFPPSAMMFSKWTAELANQLVYCSLQTADCCGREVQWMDASPRYVLHICFSLNRMLPLLQKLPQDILLAGAEGH